jgi:CRP-like cAMP-binding protein
MVQRPSGVVEPLPLIVLRAGQSPVRQGEPCAGPWTVESGVLRVSVVDDDGRELILDLAGPGDVIAGVAGCPSPWTARAIGPARLLPGPPGALDAVVERLAQLALQLAWCSVQERIERRLLDLATRLGYPVPGGLAVGVPITQDDLAAMVGASRESTNRAIRRSVAERRLDVPRRGRYVVRSPLRVVGSE